jgi:WD40 repeat protein
VQLFDLTAQRQLPALTGHSKRVTAAVWGEDSLLLTASNDKTVRFWRHAADDAGEAAVKVSNGAVKVCANRQSRITPPPFCCPRMVAAVRSSYILQICSQTQRRFLQESDKNQMQQIHSSVHHVLRKDAELCCGCWGWWAVPQEVEYVACGRSIAAQLELRIGGHAHLRT